MAETPTKDSDKWKIKKELTASDFHKNGCIISLDNEYVEKHIFRHWDKNMKIRVSADDVKMMMEDHDDHTEHEVHFRHYSYLDPVSYVVEGDFHRNFGERRGLKPGDVIGICYNPLSHKFGFSLLRRAS